MVMICEYCGSMEGYVIEEVSSSRVDDVYFDSDGEVVDKEHGDSEDYDWNEVDRRMKCLNCDSDSVFEVDDVDKFKWEHTDTDGDWSSDELPESERSKELKKKVILNNIKGGK